MLNKIKIHKWKILGGVLGAFVFAVAVFAGYKFFQLRQARTKRLCGPCPMFDIPPNFCQDGILIPGKIDECGCQMPPKCLKSCVKTDTGEEMTLTEAKEIALESECTAEGSLTGESFCNDSTGTWWLDLNIEKEGCNPACVINVSTGEAEINWRCTGVIVP